MGTNFYIEYSRPDLGQAITKVVANSQQEARRKLMGMLPPSIASLTIHDIGIGGQATRQ